MENNKLSVGSIANFLGVYKKQLCKVLKELGLPDKKNDFIDLDLIDDTVYELLEKHQVNYTKFDFKNFFQNIGKYTDEIREKYLNPSDSRYILHIGPTNSGKTYHAVEKLKKAKSGLYLCPLRLLAWEIYDRLNTDGYPTSLITGEERIIVPEAKIKASTIEMMSTSQEVEVAIIDECFMLQDKDRGKHWLRAILEVNAEEIHLILNPESEDFIANLLKLCNKTFEINKYERLCPLEISSETFDLDDLPPKTVLVSFSRISALANKDILTNMGRKVSVLYGNLPPEVKRSQIRRFLEGETDICCSTDVIGMGVNLPCDYVIFSEYQKFDGESVRPLNPLEIKQVGGRAGRYKLSEKGVISALNRTALKHIKKNFYLHSAIRKAFFGLSWEFYSSFPEEATIKDRIICFNNVDLVPEKLEHLVEKESIGKFLKLLTLADFNGLSVEEGWTFLTSPVKEKAPWFYSETIKQYKIKKTLKLPSIMNTDIRTSDYAEECEYNLADVDLYLYLTNKDIFKGAWNIKDKEFILEYKKEMISSLDNFLVKKKVKGKKKCENCKSFLKNVENGEKYCDKCCLLLFMYKNS